MPRLIIGIAGKAGVGKDSLAHALSWRFSLVHTSFAAPLKKMLEVIGLNRKDFDNNERKEMHIPAYGTSYRRLLQTLGTEWGRSHHPDFWVQVAARDWLSHNFGAVYSDVRFENEASWIRSLGGSIIHLEGPDRRLLSSDARSHASELGIAFVEGDWRIQNVTGSIEDAAQATALLIEQRLEKG